VSDQDAALDALRIEQRNNVIDVSGHSPRP
jgi:hypothetical protein